MTQQTVEKKRVSPRKPAAAKPEPQAVAKPPRKAVTAKAATKAPSVLSQVTGVAVKFFVFVEGARPVSGSRLLAHTNAALMFLGLDKQQPARKAAAVAIMGVRAVNHHVGNGNFVEQADKVKLSPQGYSFFKGRVEQGRVDAELSAAYLAAIQKGKANAAHQIKPDHLVPVGCALR